MIDVLPEAKVTAVADHLPNQHELRWCNDDSGQAGPALAT
jgi:hypothetical protein